MVTKTVTDTLVRNTFSRSSGAFVHSSLFTDSIKLVRTRTGNELRNYKQLIRERKMATTALSASQETCTFSNGLVRWRGYIGNSLWESNRFGTSFSSAALPTGSSVSYAESAAAKCLGRYHTKVNELAKPLRGQAFLGELRQTINMLRNPFKNGVDLLVSGLRLQSKGVIKGAGNVWLQYRFGILPLMSDVDGILRIAIAKAQEADIQSHRVYGSSETSSSTPFATSDDGGGSSGVKLYGTLTSTIKVERIIRFGFILEALSSLEKSQELLYASFLDYRDIPSTMWELMPWSFLIDYFVNVGSIIESLTSGNGGVNWTSDSSVTTRQSVLSVNVPVPVGSNVLLSFSPLLMTRTSRSVIRSTTPPGIPPMVFSLPGSNIRLANIAALLTGLLHKR